MSEYTDVIPPFFAKQFKIVANKVDPGSIEVAFVDKDLVESSLDEIGETVGSNVKLGVQISEETFSKIISEVYEEVSNPTPKEIRKAEREAKQKEADEQREIRRKERAERKKLIEQEQKAETSGVVYTDEQPEEKSLDIKDVLKNYSNEDLAQEIRRRRSEKPAYGKLVVQSPQQVQFSIEEMTWATGVYKVVIVAEEDITEEHTKKMQEQIDQQNAKDARTNSFSIPVPPEALNNG